MTAAGLALGVCGTGPFSDGEENLRWAAAPDGGTACESLVSTAKSQVGNVGGGPYWSWYGFGNRVEWCACFVSWCGGQCGLLESGAMPRYAVCDDGVSWFRARDRWLTGSSAPAAGDIVFFDWDGDGSADHTGIVTAFDGSTVETVEGNSSDMCRERSYPAGSGVILGYGVPVWPAEGG